MDRLFDDTFPVLPYNGTSGWSGSEASRNRAVENDANGITAARQRDVFLLLRSKGENGLTWNEAGKLLGIHHGTVSAALSNLHRRKLICRLTATRNRSSIYVCPEFVNGRETSSHKPNVSSRRMVDVLRLIADDLRQGDIDSATKLVSEALAIYETERNSK